MYWKPSPDHQVTELFYFEAVRLYVVYVSDIHDRFCENPNGFVRVHTHIAQLLKPFYNRIRATWY